MAFLHLNDRFKTILLGGLSAIALSGCIHSELISDSKKMTQGTGTPVLASAETIAVGTGAADAADDPEIYVNRYQPDTPVILGTDKKAGLYVYNIDGSVRDFAPVGPLNNVDLLEMDGQVLIGTSDRVKNGVALFGLDKDLKLRNLGFVSLPTSEAYGFCMAAVNFGDKTSPVVVVVGQRGDVAVARLNDVGGYSIIDTQRFEVGSQSEGCVIDAKTGALYIGEEAKGIWRYDVRSPSNATRVHFAPAPSDILKPDVEGLTLMHEGDKTYLIASSQGDSAFAVWQVDGDPVYKGRFSVMAGNGIDAVTGTDGVAARGGPVGPYPNGIIVMQDDVDSDGEAASTTRVKQNFKIVDWNNVKAALNIQ
ncbi:phytase [Asticcacaulis sp. SL142]|uniref:phytase n=1 Tax=Asticcacaulis sp. SL142 TaxID=2995155 RepID=UPI00226C7345|nr:phytase [Asticcacaulis sp. SL142]WAC48566.1 phytase [Asticcacaulis sp. SL142]